MRFFAGLLRLACARLGINTTMGLPERTRHRDLMTIRKRWSYKGPEYFEHVMGKRREPLQPVRPGVLSFPIVVASHHMSNLVNGDIPEMDAIDNLYWQRKQWKVLTRTSFGQIVRRVGRRLI